MPLGTSRYNLSVPLENGALLYNANSGALLSLNNADGAAVAEVLCTYPATIDPVEFDNEVLDRLTRGGFVIDREIDEIDIVRERFSFSRENAATVITVMVTNDCNLGCYYCFQSRTKDSLDGKKEAETFDFIKQRIIASGKRQVHVNWYGGEPMLKRDFIERTSRNLQDFCSERGVKYQASILSNGTFWPNSPSDFVREHKLSTVQITFDGVENTHNKIRRKRSKKDESYNQFLEAVRVVDSIHTENHVEVRFNIGPRNAEEIYDFIEYGRRRGWLAPAA